MKEKKVCYNCKVELPEERSYIRCEDCQDKADKLWAIVSKLFTNFWKDVKYYKHNTELLKTGYPKIFKVASGMIFPMKNYVRGNTAGCEMGNGKEIDMETLNKYYTEITQKEFFTIECMGFGF